MNFLRRGSQTSTETPADAPSDVDGDVVTVGGERRTGAASSPGKGRPTPSRKQAEGKKRGPAAPAPRTQREAFKRNKTFRGSKEDRRSASAERRKRMMAGDDKVLPLRDRGPARAYARDLVDARRNLMGLFMPFAVLVFASLLIQNPLIKNIGSIVCVLMLAMMVLEGLVLGRYVVGRVRQRFPQEDVRPFSFGWYAFTRATQLRKVRMPAPRVARGTVLD